MADAVVAQFNEYVATATVFLEARKANLLSAYDISMKAYESKSLPNTDDIDFEVIATTVVAMLIVNFLLSLLTKRGRRVASGIFESVALFVLLTVVGAIGLVLTIGIPYSFCYGCYHAVATTYTMASPYATPLVEQGMAAAQPYLDQAVAVSHPYLVQGVEFTKPYVTQGVDLAMKGWTTAQPHIQQGVATTNSVVDMALPYYREAMTYAEPVTSILQPYFAFVWSMVTGVVEFGVIPLYELAMKVLQPCWQTICTAYGY